ncbi:hypothetical protein RIF29_15070 [Crotalaria pallida]|uniref:GRF-type domain-containing protein n=1 Tax=Crotalaria pallida TaxID=3830 RepID=A0AAN9IIX0_CROPI
MASSSSQRKSMNDVPCKPNSKRPYSCTMDSASSSMNTTTSISQYGYEGIPPYCGCGGARAVLRTARTEEHYGMRFWGCRFYKKDVPDSGCNFFDWYKDDVVLVVLGALKGQIIVVELLLFLELVSGLPYLWFALVEQGSYFLSYFVQRFGMVQQGRFGFGMVLHWLVQQQRFGFGLVLHGLGQQRFEFELVQQRFGFGLVQERFGFGLGY